MRGLTVHIEDVQPNAADELASAAGQRSGQSALGAVGSATRLAPMSEPACSENEHRRGQLVDHYRIVKLIGVGGTARVYEAVHDFTKKPVALKIMRHRLIERRDVPERFRQEAMALASIRHEVENAGLTDDGRVFILCGVIGAGAIHIARVTHVRRSLMIGVSTGSGLAHGSSRPSEAASVVSPTATAVPERTVAAAADTGRPSSGNAHAVRIQAAAPALTNAGDRAPARAHSVPVRRREPSSSQAIETVTNTRVQAGGRAASPQNTLDEEQLAPVQRVPEDVLPASGL